MNTNRDLTHEKRSRPPWYYYILCAFALSVVIAILKNALNIETEGWLRVALMMFFIFFLPRQIWNYKSEKAKK